jgi:hypothetical protein
VPRGVPAADAGRVAPALRGVRPGTEAPVGESRRAPQAVAPTNPNPNPGAPDGAPGRRTERMAPPRQVDPARAAEVARPAPVVPAAVAPPPRVAAPPAVVAPAAEARPAEVARPVMGEPRMNRPEAPRARDERREEKVERPR